jgi:hypothetical protein
MTNGAGSDMPRQDQNVRIRYGGPGLPRHVLLVLIASAIAFPLVNHLTSHPDETVIILMPPVLCSILWLVWPDVRRMPWWKHGLYIAFLVPLLIGTVYFAASMAMGQMLWIEILRMAPPR